MLVRDTSSLNRRQAGKIVITPEGVRGIYLNTLDRVRAANWGAAFATRLWEEQPRVCKPLNESTDSSFTESSRNSLSRELFQTSPNIQSPSRRGPVVVIGFDERPTSPDIVIGAAQGLRRMGCQVIDIGQTSAACFQFSVHHLEAAGGIFVTGAGFDPSWTGLNFVGSDTLSLTSDVLEGLQRLAGATIVRPTRSTGSQRPFRADVPYQASLWKWFHALRPLQVACGTATRQLPRMLDSIFSRLPCRLIHESLPVRRRNLDDPRDPDLQRVCSLTVTQNCHLGLVIDEDGQRCVFVTEQGQPVSTVQLARLLVMLDIHEHRSTRLVIENALLPSFAQALGALEPSCHIEPTSPLQVAASMKSTDANLGFAADHRVWLTGDYTATNAILTLARVLQALSLSDTPLSELLRQGQASMR